MNNAQSCTVWRSLGTSWLLRSPLDVNSEKGHPLTLSELPYLGGLTSFPSLALWMTIHYTPLCCLITSSTSDPGFYKFPWHQRQWPLMRKLLSSIHISWEFDLKVWNKLRVWFIYWCSFNYWQAWVSHPMRAVSPGDIMSWPAISNSTVFSLLFCTSVTVSLGMVDSVLLIIQQQIKATLEQITSQLNPDNKVMG